MLIGLNNTVCQITLILLMLAATNGLAQPLALPEDGKPIQEFVISVRDLEDALAAYRDAFQWETFHRGKVSAVQAEAWGLPPETDIEEVLLGNPASRYGHVRLVKFSGMEQEIIRPGNRFWDTGGIYNVNLQVRDLPGLTKHLRTLGWYAPAEEEPYVYPGNVRGLSMLMIGPEDVVVSFQERQSPPLTGWPPFDGAAHIEIGYQFIKEVDAWFAFYRDVLGFPPGAVVDQPGRNPVGMNVYGLPHNSEGFHHQRIARVYTSSGQEQMLGARFMPNADGYDFSERAMPPNLGVLMMRFPNTDVDALAKRLADAGVALETRPADMTLPPYGDVRLLAFRDPFSGAWLEFFESQ